MVMTAIELTSYGNEQKRQPRVQINVKISQGGLNLT